MQFSFILAALAAVSSAAPTPSAYDVAVAVASGQAVTPILITPAQILAAAPTSKNCPAVAVAGQECASSATAAKGLTDAFNKYGQTTLGQMTALLGLMTLESGDFRFNVNQARVGQGTRAMLMFNFVYDYAYAQPELRDEVLRLGGGKHLVLSFDTISTVPDQVQHDIRALVLVDKYSFGAASWFLANKCDASFATALTNGGFPAFTNYIANCIGAGAVTPERKNGWCLAAKALKPVGAATPAECL